MHGATASAGLRWSPPPPLKRPPPPLVAAGRRRHQRRPPLALVSAGLRQSPPPPPPVASAATAATKVSAASSAAVGTSPPLRCWTKRQRHKEKERQTLLLASPAHVLICRHSIVSFRWLSRCRRWRVFMVAAMGKYSHELQAGSGRMPRKNQQQRRWRQKTNTETGTQRTSARRAVKMMDEDSSSSMLSMMVSNISVGNNVSLVRPALPLWLPSDG